MSGHKHKRPAKSGKQIRRNSAVPHRRRVCVKLDHTELCALLLALGLLSTTRRTDVLGASTRAELKRARALFEAALVDAARGDR